MKVLIVGAGAVGVALASSLLSSGAEVNVFARGETADYISKNGVARRGLFGDMDFGADRIKVYRNYSDIPTAMDFVIVTAKTLANEEIAAALDRNRHIFHKDTKIIIGQNGWGNVDKYLKYFDSDRIFCARIITGFQRINPGTSNITVHTAPVLLGSLFGADESVLKPLAEKINSAGIPCECSDELEQALWAKMLYNTTLNPLGAILRCSYGKLTENPYSVAIMNQLIDETFAVINAYGFKCYWENGDKYREVFYSKLIPDTYKHRSSTLQDIEKNIRTEIDTLNGCIIRLAEAKNILVPGHIMIYNLIKAIEAGYNYTE